MAPSPVIPFMVILLTLGFEAAMPGGMDMVQDSFPPFLSVDFASCTETSDGGVLAGFATFGCWVANVGKIIVNFFLFLFGLFNLLIKIATFQVPGAPVAVRIIVTSVLSMMVLWTSITLLRGN